MFLFRQVIRKKETLNKKGYVVMAHNGIESGLSVLAVQTVLTLGIVRMMQELGALCMKILISYEISYEIRREKFVGVIF